MKGWDSARFDAAIFKKEQTMTQPKFGAGQRVTISRAGSLFAPGGAYKVMQSLPLGAGPQQYRVRSDGETFDRVVDESRLEALGVD